MHPPDDTLMKMAIQVRDTLVKRYLHIPGVSVIDIGIIPGEGEATPVPVVRIHVKDKATLKTLDLPKRIQGIPIQTMISDYKLE